MSAKDDLPLPQEVWVVCANPSQQGKMSATFVCDHRHEAMDHVKEVLDHHYAHNYRPWRVARYELAEMTEERARKILYDYVKPGEWKLEGGGIWWPDNNGDLTIDGSYEVEFMGALLWWVKNMRPA